MMQPKRPFLWLTITAVMILGPLFIWDPFMCASDKAEFATAEFAEEAKSSRCVIHFLQVLLCLRSFCNIFAISLLSLCDRLIITLESFCKHFVIV
jgi:hypothetical protein